MKRKVSLLLLVFTLFLSGCGQKSQTFSNRLDKQQIGFVSNNGQLIAEGNYGYYFLVGNFLYFSEKDFSKVIPLCNKPDCLHIEETNSANLINCNAYVGNASSIGWYQNYIYVISDIMGPDGAIIHNTVLQISQDGSKRENIYTFGTFVSGITMHNGFLYNVEHYYSKDGHSNCKIVQHKIDNMEKGTVIYESELNDAQIDSLTFVNSKAYFCEYSPTEWVYRAKMIDLKSQRSNRIFTNNDNILPEFKLNNSFLVAHLFPFVSGNDSGEYFKYNLAGEDPQFFFQEETLNKGFEMDDKYYYLTDLYWKFDSIPEDGLKTEIYLLEDNSHVTTVQLPEDIYAAEILAGNEDALFAYNTNNDFLTYYYLPKHGELETNKFQKLIKVNIEQAYPTLSIQ